MRGLAEGRADGDVLWTRAGEVRVLLDRIDELEAVACPSMDPEW